MYRRSAKISTAFTIAAYGERRAVDGQAHLRNVCHNVGRWNWRLQRKDEEHSQVYLLIHPGKGRLEQLGDHQGQCCRCRGQAQAGGGSRSCLLWSWPSWTDLVGAPLAG